jgi:hypothetical protein
LLAEFKFKPWDETSYYAFAICIKGFSSVFKLNKKGGLGPGKQPKTIKNEATNRKQKGQSSVSVKWQRRIATPVGEILFYKN